MCGGDIQAESGAVFGTCDSCGTTSTLPKANEERVVNLFNRANHFRRLNEFDKALTYYENILTEDSANAEAHWGVVLCRYGIEYVEDPKTRERVPTCHRVQYESILADADYLATLENAPDSYAKGLYEAEAKKISEIQKGILAVAGKEEPYDIFICYKETTEGGSRTKDSTLAQDIYFQLTNDGYKVFFSRITLEDRLGRDYEPYIFSALNSAKVMLVVGTKKEHFEAVWVKNEWSRFLSLMKNDRSRLLIPCYRDMDAYDMPDELAHLQSQDMGKIGFIQDLVRGVKKVLDANNAPKVAEASTVANTNLATPGVESFMKRGWLFLEDSDWKQANEYFDKVLDIDPEYAPAYVGKLCAELNAQNEACLANSNAPLDDNSNYKKALRFSELEYRAKIEGYNQEILNRIAERLRKKEEEERLEKERREEAALLQQKQKEETYQKLVQARREASILDEYQKFIEYQKLVDGFERLGQYKDCMSLKNECRKKLLELELYLHNKNICKYCGGKRAYFGGKCKSCGKGGETTCSYCGGKTKSAAKSLTNITNICQSCGKDKFSCSHCSGRIGFSGTCKSCGRPWDY